MDVGGGEVVLGGVGDGAELGGLRIEVITPGLEEGSADPFGEGDALESGEVLDFSVFCLIEEQL